MRFPASVFVAAGAFLLVSGALGAFGRESPQHGWRADLTPLASGKLLPMPRGEGVYRFGWSGVTAAEMKLRFSRPSSTISQLDVATRTIGPTRGLWRMDATALMMSDLAATRSLRVRQEERYRGRSIVSALEFEDRQVLFSKGRLPRATTKTPEGMFSGLAADRDALRALTGEKVKRFKFPEILDLHSALLFIRSQPLKKGDVIKLMVFQDNSAYLAEVRVVGRENIKVAAGRFNAIKLDLKLNWVDKHLVLRPHENFRRASGWISDDKDRLLLKVDSEVFVGSIWGELVKFTRNAHAASDSPRSQTPFGNADAFETPVSQPLSVAVRCTE